MTATLASTPVAGQMSFRAILQRIFLTRPGRPRRLGAWAGAVLTCALAFVPAASSGGAAWRDAAPLPMPRTEVVAARAGSEIVVVGGYRADGSTSARADAYSPGRDRWRRLPDLPLAVNHAAAAGYRGRAYVVGGYAGEIGGGNAVRAAFVLDRGRWHRLARPPAARAAAAAAVVGSKLYVVGGVGPEGLATRAMVYDLRRGRWSTTRGPRPREHLAAAAVGGRVYAIAGRLGGYDRNLTTVQAYAPSARRWITLPPIPAARGGTGAAAIGRTIVSVGGEEPGGTIRSVFALDTRTRRWRRLADLPTPRHGLGVAAAADRVYVIGGGTRPGLTVSNANEYLDLPS